MPVCAMTLAKPLARFWSDHSSVDINGDGVISKPEEQVAGIDLANPNPVNYDWSYSYSVGVSYQMNNQRAILLG